MRDIFLLFLTIIFFVFSLNSRIAGLYTYWWISIFRPQAYVWPGSVLTSLRISAIAFCLLVIPSLLQRKAPSINHPISVLMILLVVLLFIADTLNGCETAFIVRPNTVLTLSVLFFVVLLSSELSSDLKKIFWLVAVISLSLAYHSGKGGIHALISGSNNYGADNLRGLFYGSNAYAMGTSILLFFMIFTFQHISSYLIYEQMNKWYNKPFVLMMFKVLLAILILGSMYNIISLSSRGSFLAVSMGLVLWVRLQEKKNKIFFVACLIACLGLAVLPLPEGFKERISSVFADEDDLDRSAKSRPHYWRTAREIVADHPLGVGPGCYPAYYDQYDVSNGLYGHKRSVHSSHFQILNDSGYLGLIIWILLFFISYRKLFKIRKLSKQLFKDKTKYKFYFDISNMLLCSQSVFLIGGSFYEYAYNDIIWLVLALVISVENSFKKEIKLLETPVPVN